MPTFRGVSVNLESQYDIMVLPEYPPPEVPLLPYHEGASHTLQTKTSISSFKASCSPSLSHESATSPQIVEIYVPLYPASQFWISYGIAPSALSKAVAQTRFVYFKLIMSGRCVVSWGAGEDEQWKGKTMWGLFRGGSSNGWVGRKAVEKKGFFFQGGDVEQEFEVQVFRARGRRRVSREFEERKRTKGKKDVELINLGLLGLDSPQRFYQYALLDPVDEPYVTFRYHFRTWKQLDVMGLLQPADISQEEGVKPDRSASSSFHVSAEERPELDETSHDQPDRDSVDDHFGILIGQDTLSLSRRLSVPPRIRLMPTTSSVEPSSPIKQDVDDGCSRSVSPLSEGDDIGGQDAAEARRDWLVRTPSPTKPHREKSDSPPLSSARKRTGTLLRGVLESAMRRKASQASPKERRFYSP